MGIENWMPVYTAELLASCADMSPAQFGSYMRLLCYAWQSGGLPNDMEACCRIAGGCTPADWSVVRKRLVVIDAGTSEERLSHARLESERGKQQDKYDKKVEAIAKARAARIVSSNDDSLGHNTVVNDVNNPVNNGQLEPEQELELEQDSHKRVKGRTPRARRTPIVPLPPIGWNAADGFTGITDAHMASWKSAFPLVDIERSKARAHANLLVTTKKYTSSGIGRYLKNWLQGDQESAELNGRQPAAPQKTFRPDAGKALTASEYAEWKRAQEREAYVRAKARKRTGSMNPIGDAINERFGSEGPAAG